LDCGQLTARSLVPNDAPKVDPATSGSRALVRSKYLQHWDNRTAAEYDLGGMKKSIYLLAVLGLFAACEQKTTTINPPAEKKESTTTVVNPPSEKKESTTIINPPGGSTTTKEEKTQINVNTSPNP
jgi:hypothetical protein